MNYCKNCGAKLPENSDQCNICGVKQPGVNMNGQQNTNQTPQQMNGNMGQNPYMPNNFDNPYQQQNQQSNFSNQAKESEINQKQVFEENSGQLEGQNPSNEMGHNKAENGYSQMPNHTIKTEQESGRNLFHNQQVTSDPQNLDYQQTYPRRSQTVSNHHNSLDYATSGSAGLVFMILGWVSVALAIFSGMLWLPLPVLFAGGGFVMGYLYRSYHVKHGMIILIMSIDAGILGIMLGIGFAIRSGISMMSGLF